MVAVATLIVAILGLFINLLKFIKEESFAFLIHNLFCRLLGKNASFGRIFCLKSLTKKRVPWLSHKSRGLRADRRSSGLTLY